MPEPEVVPATEVTPQVIEPVVETPPAEPETPPAAPSEDGEPGGDTPEAVFARKQYREAKTARAEAQQERDARIRAEERLKVAEAPKKEEVEPVWGLSHVVKALAEGRVQPDEAEQYLQTQTLPKLFNEFLETRERKKAEQQPQEKALAEVNEYITLIPQLATEGSEERQKVVNEVRRIMAEDGVPYDFLVQRRAVRSVFGNLSDVKKRGEVDRTTRAGLKLPPVDVGGGGGGGGVA